MSDSTDFSKFTLYDADMVDGASGPWANNWHYTWDEEQTTSHESPFDGVGGGARPEDAKRNKPDA